MTILIGSDHAGKEMRYDVIKWLNDKNYTVLDCGSDNEKSNYAIEGIKVAENIASGKGDFGIIICGSGIGISIAANKVKGVRAALVYNQELASLSRVHNDANIIALGARFFSLEEMTSMIDTFLSTQFEGGRHEDRVDTISDYEESCVGCE
ncbi:MAG: ribose 5-phosphate isomerase B [Spiroplasma sp.]|nr:ribose 5-phosphate isomerase B [Mycoplasmatales bacterium]